jgi:hypothetical protein
MALCAKDKSSDCKSASVKRFSRRKAGRPRVSAKLTLARANSADSSINRKKCCPSCTANGSTTRCAAKWTAHNSSPAKSGSPAETGEIGLRI